MPKAARDPGAEPADATTEADEIGRMNGFECECSLERYVLNGHIQSGTGECPITPQKAIVCFVDRWP